MKKFRKTLFLLALAFALMGSAAATIVIDIQSVEAATKKNGWFKTGGKWYFYKNNNKVKGWITDKGKKYYLGNDKDKYAMATGLQGINGRSYYFDKSGAMVKSRWINTARGWMYFQSSGVAFGQGWHKIGGKYYHFKSNHCMTPGGSYVDGRYLDANGARIVNQWLPRDKRKYCDANGYTVKGWKKINNYWYYFNADHLKVSNSWVKTNRKYYYLQSNGIMATLKWVGSYYVNRNGERVYNTWLANIYIGSNGKKTFNAWVKVGNNWAYCQSDGNKKILGWLNLKSGTYYFQQGIMLTNKSLKDTNGKTYYLQGDGKMAKNKWVGLRWYDKNGVWTKSRT